MTLTLDGLTPAQRITLWVHGRLVVLSQKRRITERITITETGWKLFIELRRTGFEPTRDQIREALLKVDVATVEDGFVDLLLSA